MSAYPSFRTPVCITVALTAVAAGLLLAICVECNYLSTHLWGRIAVAAAASAMAFAILFQVVLHYAYPLPVRFFKSAILFVMMLTGGMSITPPSLVVVSQAGLLAIKIDFGYADAARFSLGIIGIGLATLYLLVKLAADKLAPAPDRQTGGGT